MPRFTPSPSRKLKALACQADEDDLCPSEHCSNNVSPTKSHVSRSLSALKCINPLSVGRSGRGVDEPLDGMQSSSGPTKYYRVAEEQNQKLLSDGSELKLFFRGGGVNSQHNLRDELFNAAGALRAVEEGSEWEDEYEFDRLQEQECQEVSSPGTTTTTATTVTTTPASPQQVVIFEDSSLESDAPQPPILGFLDDTERIGIHPISMQLPSVMSLGFGQPLAGATTSKPQEQAEQVAATEQEVKETAEQEEQEESEHLKPDPPASKVPDSNFSYDISTSHEEEKKSESEDSLTFTITKRCDGTVVSELTCDFSDTLSTPSAATVQKVKQQSLERPTLVLRETQPPPPKPEPSTQQSVKSHGSAKMQDLISKFESLSHSKATIERYSVVSKLQKAGGGVPTSLATCVLVEQAAAVAEIPTATTQKSTTEEETPTAQKSATRDRGFFWRSRPASLHDTTGDTSLDDSDFDQSTVSRESSRQ